MKSTPKYHQSSLAKLALIILCILAPLAISSQQIPPLSQDILERIFDQSTFSITITGQVVVIYVCQQKNPSNFDHFSDYCVDHSCAFLDKTNSIHQRIRNFIGHPHKEYFAILDAPRQLKYILDVKDKTIKYKDIYNFEADFTSLKLQPFYASEEEPTQFFEPCRKLVGKNFDAFLALKSPIKIVYLYTEQKSCSICGQMLRGFADIAQKIYRQNVVAFGYFDIFLNDHKRIPFEMAPYFLVFKQDDKEPYGIEGEKFSQLQNAIINIIAEQIYPGYKDSQFHEGEIDPQDLIEQRIEDIQEISISEREEKNKINFEL